MVADREARTDNATAGGSSRRRRSFWFDPRFAVGLILVVISVLGVVGLVGAANASVTVLAARGSLTPGQRVHTADLLPTSVRVGQTAQLYLRPSDVPAAGIVITRAVAPGELVPHSAVGSEAGRALTSIVVSVDSPLAASIVPGSRVDVWAADQAGADSGATDSSEGAGSDEPVGGAAVGGVNGFAPPTVIVSSAIVVRLVDQKQLVAANGSSVEVLVPKSDTASVLDAIANGAVLSVLPVDLPLGN